MRNNLNKTFIGVSRLPSSLSPLPPASQVPSRSLARNELVLLETFTMYDRTTCLCATRGAYVYFFCFVFVIIRHCCNDRCLGRSVRSGQAISCTFSSQRRFTFVYCGFVCLFYIHSGFLRVIYYSVNVSSCSFLFCVRRSVTDMDGILVVMMARKYDSFLFSEDRFRLNTLRMAVFNGNFEMD